jgi:hypothetical protein
MAIPTTRRDRGRANRRRGAFLTTALALLLGASVACTVENSDGSPALSGEGGVAADGVDGGDRGGGDPTGSADGGVGTLAPADAGDGQALTDGGPSEGTEVGAPEILSLGTNVTRITEGEALKIVAVVAMPGGLQNLVGGELTTEDGAVTLGAFLATTQGTYSIDVTWAALRQALDFSFYVTKPLTFRATFYSNAGKRSFRAVTVTLHCDGIRSDRRGACKGECRDLAGTCGGCDRACPSAAGVTCSRYDDPAAVCRSEFTGPNSCDLTCGSSSRCVRARRIHPGDRTGTEVACNARVDIPVTLSTADCVCNNGVSYSGLSDVSCADRCNGNLGCGRIVARGTHPTFGTLDGPLLPAACTRVLRVGDSVGMIPTGFANVCSCEGAPVRQNL